MSTDDVRIGVSGRVDAPTIGQFDRDHAVRRLQQVMENEERRTVRRTVCNLDPSQFRPCASAKSELNSPSEQHAGDDAMAPADLGGAGTWSLGFAYDREFFFVAEAASVAASVARWTHARGLGQAAFDDGLLSSAASISAYLRPGTGVKLRSPVDVHLVGFDQIEPTLQGKTR
ncbi:hypothetical protein BLN97_26215 [Bradyrhizobium elkanii]|nr:hypothetical protein BLN97_26215 [Bradyrhizobium elkanii]